MLCRKVIDTGALETELPRFLDAYNSACAKARERRDKQIAHFDLNAMLDSKQPGPSRAEVELALEALRGVMNCISLHFTGSQTAYEQIVLMSDGDSLISVLQQGLRYRELVRSGVIPVDDLRRNAAPHGDDTPD